MSLTASEFMKKFAASPDVSLTLFNETGESYHAGDIKSLIHTKAGVRIRWEMPSTLDNILPLTYAALHRGKKVWSIVSIAPIDNGYVGSELELVYGN